MAEYGAFTAQSDIEPATRVTPPRYGIFLHTYTMTTDNPAPPNFIDYPRQYPLENSWLKTNPK